MANIVENLIRVSNKKARAILLEQNMQTPANLKALIRNAVETNRVVHMQGSDPIEKPEEGRVYGLGDEEDTYSPKYDNDSGEIVLYSAWSPAIDVCRGLSILLPDATIRISWLEEGFSDSGRSKWRNGVPVEKV